MSLAEEKLEQIKDFISSLKLDSPPLENPDQRLRTTYNTFHGLLLLDLAVDQSNFSDRTKNHFQELLSDASSSLFLSLVGSFKPSRLVLRGAIENTLRFFVGSRKVDPASLTTVAALFAEARKLAKDSNVITGEIGKLESRYAELCKTTHAVHVDYMALTVPFENLFRDDPTAFEANLKVILPVLQNAFNICFAVLHGFLNRIDHQSADTIRGLAPRAVKASLND